MHMSVNIDMHGTYKTNIRCIRVGIYVTEQSTRLRSKLLDYGGYGVDFSRLLILIYRAVTPTNTKLRSFSLLKPQLVLTLSISHT